MRNKSSDSILTGHGRQMSVSLRSVLLNNKGRLLNRLFNNGWVPAWQELKGELLTKAVVEASPYEELDYTISGTGEQRTLRVPGYKHGFAVHALPGIGKSAGDRYAILGNREIWKVEERVDLNDWLKTRNTRSRRASIRRCEMHQVRLPIRRGLISIRLSTPTESIQGIRATRRPSTQTTMRTYYQGW